MLDMKPAVEVARSSLGLGAHASAGPSYIYQIRPLHHGLQLAALCSDDSVRVFNSERLDSAPAWLFHTKQEGVTQLNTLEWDSQALILTTGRGGAVKAWDQRIGGGESQRAVAVLEDEKPAAILALASCPSLPVIAIGTENDLDRRSEAAIQIWDLRSPAKPQLKYVESHSDDITDLHWDLDSKTLLSASSDGLVNIYDTSIADEGDALLQIINHGSSVHHANFLTENEVFALSNDEQLSIYRRRDSTEGTDDDDEEDEGPPSFVIGDVRPLLDCEYVVDVHRTGLVYAGSYSAQRLDIVRLSPTPIWELKAEDGLRLEGAHGEEIVRCLYIDEKTATVFTGGEDGFVRMWKEARDGKGASGKGNGDEMDEG